MSALNSTSTTGTTYKFLPRGRISPMRQNAGSNAPASGAQRRLLAQEQRSIIRPCLLKGRVKNKIYPSADAAVADVQDGTSVMFGGFGGAGFPHELIRAVGRKGSRNLFAISNNCGTGESELGVLFKNKQIQRVIAAFPGPQSIYFQQQVETGEVEFELVPQGILCERMRAAGAGIPAFYSPVGVGTEVADGKEERVVDGRRCILESALLDPEAIVTPSVFVDRIVEVGKSRGN